MRQALPDYAIEAPLSRADPSFHEARSDQLQRTAASLRDFLQQQVHESDIKRRASLRKKAMDDSRLPNRYYTNALDTALRRSGHVGLKHFVPEVRVGALAESESRDFVPDQGDDGDDGQPLSKVRACVASPFGERYELPRISLDGRWFYPALWLCIDTGSVGFAFALWYFTHIRARGGFTFDPWHAEARDLEFAYTQSGMKCIKVEGSIVLNCLIGPFDRAGHFRRFSEAAKRMFETSDYRLRGPGTHSGRADATKPGPRTSIWYNRS